MKKVIALVVIVALAVTLWAIHFSYVRRATRSVQGDPARAVEAFMDSAAKLSGLMWDEQTRENLTKWTKGSEEEKKQLLEKYKMEDPRRFFQDEGFARAVVSALCIFHFDSFSLKQTEVEEGTARVTVQFLPLDVFGIRKTVRRLGAPERETKKEPVSVPFHLERHWHRWYIVDVGGELEQLAKSFHKLGKYK